MRELICSLTFALITVGCRFWLGILLTIIFATVSDILHLTVAVVGTARSVSVSVSVTVATIIVSFATVFFAGRVATTSSTSARR